MDVLKDDHNWKPWKFRKPPANYWSDLAYAWRQRLPWALQQVRQWVEEDIATKLGVRNTHEWRNLFDDNNNPTPHLTSFLNKHITILTRLQKFGDLSQVLASIYPNVLHTTYTHTNAWDHTFVQSLSKRDLRSPRDRRQMLDEIVFYNFNNDLKCCYNLQLIRRHMPMPGTLFRKKMVVKHR